MSCSPGLGKSGNVSFIFDTGADTSLLMPLDAQRMGIDYGMFENEVNIVGDRWGFREFHRVGVFGLCW